MTLSISSLVRAGVHRFLFGQFNFNNEEIDNVISSYDDESKELIIFGRRVCLDPDLLSSATKIPRSGGVMLTTKKTLKVEKAEMASLSKTCYEAGQHLKIVRDQYRVHLQKNHKCCLQLFAMILIRLHIIAFLLSLLCHYVLGLRTIILP
jgi:hypothetical protein